MVLTGLQRQMACPSSNRTTGSSTICRLEDLIHQPLDIQTKQDLVIKSGTTNLFMIQGNKIRINDANKSISFTPATLRKFGTDIWFTAFMRRRMRLLKISMLILVAFASVSFGSVRHSHSDKRSQCGNRHGSSIMKATFLFVLSLWVITTLAVPGLGKPIGTANQSLIDESIDNVDLKASNIHLMLSRLSAATKFPIGLEVSPNDDLLVDRHMKLQIQKGTFRTALDLIVQQNPLYTWRFTNGVVNVLPTDVNRDHLIKTVLGIKLERFAIQPGMSRFALRQTVTAIPKVKSILTRENVDAENQSFMSRDFDPLGSSFSLEVSDISITDLLNRVIRDSQTNYWVVVRQGERKEFFVLNLRSGELLT